MVLKGVAKDAYQRLCRGWAETDTPTTTTPTTAQRGRPRKISIGLSLPATSSATPSSQPTNKCPPDVIALYSAVKASTVSVCVCVFNVLLALVNIHVHVHVYTVNEREVRRDVRETGEREDCGREERG